MRHQRTPLDSDLAAEAQAVAQSLLQAFERVEAELSREQFNDAPQANDGAAQGTLKLPSEGQKRVPVTSE